MDIAICVFGDSTSWGAWDLEKGGWVNRLWLDFAQKHRQHFWLYNLGIPGGTTETIISRLENELRPREMEKGDVFIFQTGRNDASYEKNENEPSVSLEKFKANLGEMIKKARAVSDKILFIGNGRVDESRTKPVSWADVYYTNENIRKYDEIMREVCKNSGVGFLDTYDFLSDVDLFDGLHPNASGHEKIYQKVKSFLVTQNWV